MKYEIIEIKFDEVSGVEVAYLLDSQQGRVLRVLVDDYVGDTVVKTPLRHQNRTRFIADREDEIGAVAEPAAPIRRRRSIMPPHLRGVMIPADQPGADVEKRIV